MTTFGTSSIARGTGTRDVKEFGDFGRGGTVTMVGDQRWLPQEKLVCLYRRYVF